MAKIKEFKNIIILIFYHGASSVHIWCTSVIDLHVRVGGHYRVNFKHYPCHYSTRIKLKLALFIGELFIFTNFDFFYNEEKRGGGEPKRKGGSKKTRAAGTKKNGK